MLFPVNFVRQAHFLSDLYSEYRLTGYKSGYLHRHNLAEALFVFAEPLYNSAAVVVLVAAQAAAENESVVDSLFEFVDFPDFELMS